MKPATAYTLGLFTGLALSAAFIFWSQSKSPVFAPQAGAAVAANGQNASTSPTNSDSANATPPASPSATSPDSLESALREIKEAGMVVIPQEFAKFLMPSLLSTNPEPAVRQVLQLDEREASALAKARTKFENALQQTIDAHLQVIEVKDGVVTATLPAFVEERQKLINSWRDESLAGLDSESAAMASHIDFDRAIYGLSQGRFDLTVTFKPSSDLKKVAVEYRGQSASGNYRENYSHRGGVPASHFLKRFPSLQPHFPQLREEAKP